MTYTPSIGQRFETKFDSFTVIRYDSETDWSVRWDDGVTIGSPENSRGAGDTFAGYLEEFEARPMAVAVGVAASFERPTQDVGGCCCEEGRAMFNVSRNVLGGDGPVVTYNCPVHGWRKPAPDDRPAHEQRGWIPR